MNRELKNNLVIFINFMNVIETIHKIEMYLYRPIDNLCIQPDLHRGIHGYTSVLSTKPKCTILDLVIGAVHVFYN